MKNINPYDVPVLRRPARGFTLIELVVVVIIISILLAVAAEKLLKTRALAERAAVVRAIGNMRSALGMQLAKDIADDNWRAIEALPGSNPMALMTRIPGDYLGALADPDPGRIKGMHWYFDTATHALVYRIQYADGFKSPLPGPPRLRFRIVAQYADRNGNGVFDPGTDRFFGLDIVPLEHATWLNGTAGAD